MIGTSCPTGQFCVAGKCALTCAAGRTICSGSCIDTVTDAIIGWGHSFSRHALSAIHNGVYSNYLGWAVIGLIAVLTLVFL